MRCHVCDNDLCTNSTTVMCPATQTVCKTITSGWCLQFLILLINWLTKKSSPNLGGEVAFCKSDQCHFSPLVITSSTSVSLIVNKNCSSLLSCVTPLNIATEWSMNRGFTKQSHNQMCCMTDNCNFQTLAGKICCSLSSIIPQYIFVHVTMISLSTVLPQSVMGHHVRGKAIKKHFWKYDLMHFSFL